MTTERKLFTFFGILAAGFTAALAFHATSRYALGLPAYPYGTFLFDPNDRFNDFRNLYNMMRFPERENVLLQYYVPLFQGLYFIPQAFSKLPISPNMALFAYLGTTSSLVILAVWRSSSASASTASRSLLCFGMLLSYPLIFTTDRANLEVVVFLLLWLLLKDFSQGRYLRSMIWLGIALSIKPFPIVFSALFLTQRRFLEPIGSACIAVALNLILLSISPFYNSITEFGALKIYQEHYAFSNAGLYFGHSLWGLVKAAGMLLVPSKLSVDVWRDLAPIYFYSSAVGFCAITVWMYFRRPALWQQITLVVCAMNLLPFVSGDYKLLHIFLPVLYFLQAPSAPRWDGYFLCLFGLLLIPKAYGHLPGIPEASLAVIFNPLLMISLIAVTFLAAERGVGVAKPTTTPRLYSLE